ncbi:hypothetical protein AAVH_15045 [Aphelenchoides avenae]|nr:hypothetical protein AAVH_15045 [Aphelenchus avenae]
MLNDSSPDDGQPADDAAQPAVAPGGPSAPEDPMGIDIAQKNKESGNSLILPPNKDTDASHPGNGHPSVANAAERRSPPDSATPHTAEVHHSPHSAPDTIAFGSHASGQCQKPLLACITAYGRAPSSSTAKPIIALFDSSADHSSCSTILALELQLPVSSSISVVLDGELAVTIAATLATMPYRSVPTSATYKQGLLPTQNGSLVPSALKIRPHIVIGHDAQHLFRSQMAMRLSCYRYPPMRIALHQQRHSRLAQTAIRASKMGRAWAWMGMGTNSVEPTITQDAGSQSLDTTLGQSIPTVNAAAAVATLDVTTVDTAIRVDVRDTQRTITAQQTSTRDVYIMPPSPVPLTLTGPTASDATLGQLPAVAGAAAVLTTAPATPEDAARVAPAVQVLPLRGASSAMDFEQSNGGPADTEGTPSVAENPLPAQEEPLRMRTSTAESSGVEILERDDSSGVLCKFSHSPAPEPSYYPHINQQALARLYPQASQDILDKLWEDYQKLKPRLYALCQPGAKAAGMAKAVPQMKPSELGSSLAMRMLSCPTPPASSQAQDTGSTSIIYSCAADSLMPSEASCSDYGPLHRYCVPHPDEVTDAEDAVVDDGNPPLSCELSGKPAELLEALISGDERQSSRPLDQFDSQQEEIRQSGFPLNAKETARETTNQASTMEKSSIALLGHEVYNIIDIDRQAAGQRKVSDTSGFGTAPQMSYSDAETDPMSHSTSSDDLAPSSGHPSVANAAEGRSPSGTASEPRNPERSTPPRPYCDFCDCARCALVHQTQLCQQCFRADHRTADCNRAHRRCACCGTRHHVAPCARTLSPAVPAAERQPPSGLGQPSVVNTTEGPGSSSQPMEAPRIPGTGHPWMVNAVRGRSLTGPATIQTSDIPRNPGLGTLRRPMPLKAAVHRYRPTPSGPGLHRPSDAEGGPVQAREDQPPLAIKICRGSASDTTGDRRTPHRRRH